MNKSLKGFLCGCVHGLIVVVAIGIFILGVFLVFTALEYQTWQSVVGIIVYIVVLFGVLGALQ